MTTEELTAAGHEPMVPLQALRARSLDCCAYQETEVALCPALQCPPWPYRMGTHLWRRPTSEVGREVAGLVMTNLNFRRGKRGGISPPDSPPDKGIASLSAEGSEVAP